MTQDQKSDLFGWSAALLAGVLLVAPVVVEAQETYQLSATAGQVSNFVEPGRETRNEMLCDSAGLALDCTTAQLQAVEGFESEVIYADSEAGRETFVVEDLCRPQVAELKNTQRRWDRRKAREAWDALNQAGKNAVCSALGLADGCELY